jgi:hypothetical protein
MNMTKYLNMNTKHFIFYTILSLAFAGLHNITSAQDNRHFNGLPRPETLTSLAQQFTTPPDAYKPHVWWHWLGSNFSKSGITKDFQAMKESGIGGVIIFNAPNWLDPAKVPWKHQTYRSEAYWEAIEHSLAEAQKRNMTVGIHNSPGWSSTGGPWISPEQGMQGVFYSKTLLNGAQKQKTALPNPKANTELAPYFRDVAVVAVPAHKDLAAADVVDISQYMDAAGTLEWKAPAGEWLIYRIGYAPTMSRTHPTPEEIADISLEVDKFNAAAIRKHWENVLTPFTARFGKYIGTTFNSIWIDSYEAGSQSWSPNFRADFIRIKGYDPVPQMVLADVRGDTIFDSQGRGLRPLKASAAKETKLFVQDFEAVSLRLFMDGYKIAKEMINAAGFQFYWEPYVSWGGGLFDIAEGTQIADVPVTEFWVHDRRVSGNEALLRGVVAGNKRILGAEAFTGMEYTCRFNESPAILKRPADMGYNAGANLYFLHSWAHQPFDDKYLPGWGFALYGTHFSRHQTWFEPGKAFFTYLARCQMLLQQGTFISRNSDVVQRRTPDAEIFFVRNLEAREKTVAFPVTDRVPELWDAYAGAIKSTSRWEQRGDSTFVTLKMERDESVFVVFPTRKTAYAKQPELTVLKETPAELTGAWSVYFQPKIGDKPFKKTFPSLSDFSRHSDAAIKYFAGTATYEKTFRVEAADLKENRRVTLDLGALYDIADLEINGQRAGVLWCPPYRTDITPFLKAGSNTLKVRITNNWANCLIGDEQYPEDFEWTDRNQGLHAMTALPDWFLNNQPRPVKERKTFIPWYYFKKDSPLYPAGLLGPVKILKQEVK